MVRCFEVGGSPTCECLNFSKYRLFLEKIEVKIGLIHVISTSHFLTSSTLLIFFVSGPRFWKILVTWEHNNKLNSFSIIGARCQE